MIKFVLFTCATATILLHLADASICKPLSYFKVDCNVCMCKSSGREFSCTEKVCPQIPYRDKFIEEESPSGYRILIPKKIDQQDTEAQDFTLQRRSAEEVPPSSLERLFYNNIDESGEDEEESVAISDMEEAARENFEHFNY